MRLLTLATLLAALPWAAQAAPTWQTITSEPGKRIELDSTSIKRDGNSVQAQGRIVLEKELIDNRSGTGYRIIEAITRYDCGARSANTIKRTFKKNDTEVVREEELKSNEMPVRSGTLDDKVLREVCRPPKDSQAEVAQKANDAADLLKQANESLLKQQNAKAEKAPVVKASEQAPLPSIKPNIKPPTDAPKAAAPVPAAPPAPAAPAPVAATPAPTPPKASTYTIYTAPTKPAPAKKSASSSGYMLDIKASEAVKQHAHIHWNYEGEGGPENWAKIDPRNTACATGQRQSPIDIRDGIRVDLDPIKFNYRPSMFRVVNNGHTIQVDLGDSAITLTGKTYELVQFHFHRPSEEKINGQRFDMVAHLVHKADDGQLAVVAVLLERGNENPFIQTVWNNLPLEKNKPVTPPSAMLDLSTLLPATRSYYTYMGSLTTPPCTEDVLWLVMKQPVQLSQDQINIFSRLYRNNARPIQPSAGRLIKEDR